MNFLESLGSFFSNSWNFGKNLIDNAIDFLAKPLAFLFSILEGFLYLIEQLFRIVIEIVMLFIALFQFFFAIVEGFLRTIFSFLTFNYHDILNPVYPLTTYQGLEVVIDLASKVGLTTIVPLLAMVFLWIFFIINCIGLLGGNPYSNSITRSDKN